MNNLISCGKFKILFEMLHIFNYAMHGLLKNKNVLFESKNVVSPKKN